MSCASNLRLFGVLAFVLAVFGAVRSTEPTPTVRQLNETILNMAANLFTNLKADDSSNSTTSIMMLLDQLGSNKDIMPFIPGSFAEAINGLTSSNNADNGVVVTADNSSNPPEDMGNYDALKEMFSNFIGGMFADKIASMRSNFGTTFLIIWILLGVLFAFAFFSIISIIVLCCKVRKLRRHLQLIHNLKKSSTILSNDDVYLA